MPCSTCKFARPWQLLPEVETEIKVETPFLFGKPREVEVIKPGSYWDDYWPLWTLDEIRQLCHNRNEDRRNTRQCRLNPKAADVPATYECSHYTKA